MEQTRYRSLATMQGYMRWAKLRAAGRRQGGAVSKYLGGDL
jgi:hypothetical protein